LSFLEITWIADSTDGRRKISFSRLFDRIFSSELWRLSSALRKVRSQLPVCGSSPCRDDRVLLSGFLAFGGASRSRRICSPPDRIFYGPMIFSLPFGHLPGKRVE
jgi:hypothetical protein